MLNKNLLYVAGLMLFACGCSKTEELKGSEKSFAYVSLTNANANGKVVHFFIDGNKKSINAPLLPNSTILGTYVGINGDTSHAVTVRDSATAANIDYFVGTINGTPNNAYSLFVYDTLKAGKFKTLYLTSNRSLSPGNITTSNVRFLNLSPKSPVLDLWLVRIVGTTRTDSVKASGLSAYVGSSTPNVAALSTYTSVRSSQAAGANGTGSAITGYAAKLTLANTNTTVSSASLTIIPGRNYTLYARGLYPATALSVLIDN